MGAVQQHMRNQVSKVDLHNGGTKTVLLKKLFIQDVIPV